MLDRPPVDHLMDQFRSACQEVDRRLRTGETSGLEAWVEPGGSFADDPDLAIELIFTEYVTREDLNQQPTPEEFYNRFPDHAEALARLFGVDQLLQDSQSLQSIRPAPPSSTLPAVPPAAVPRSRTRRNGFPNSPTPEQIGPYTILHILGTGGMGVVYRGWDSNLRRAVAIKQIRAGAGATQTDISRLRLEAAAVARLTHPNIVQIYEVGDDHGMPYLALEFVPGPTLRDHLAPGPMPAMATATLLESLARAIQHAHSRGVFHRDLKPANILLLIDSGLPHRSSDATLTGPLNGPLIPKITDFGLAALRYSEADLTATGHLIGTVAYMAPEQAEGRPGWVSPAVDVYALGVILYECLTGRPPFTDESPLEVIRRALHEQPIAVRQLIPSIPHDLETICLKCLRKSPSDRYANAEALADDLHRFQIGEPIAARPVSRLRRLIQTIRRRPARAAALSVALVALTALLLIWARFTRDLEIERDATIAQKQTADRALDQATVARDDAQTQFTRAEQLLDRTNGMLYAATVNRAATLSLSEPISAQRLLRSEDTCPPSRREFAWHYVDAFCSTQRANRREHDTGINAMAASEDGQFIITGDMAGRVVGWNSVNGRSRFRLESPHHGPVTAVAVSGDGRRFITGGADGRVIVWDSDTHQPIGEPRQIPGVILAVTTNTTGDRIAAAGTSAENSYQGGPIQVWNPSTGAIISELAHVEASVRGLAMSPDGKTLVAGYAQRDRMNQPTGGAIIWDIEKQQRRLTEKNRSGIVRAVAFSSDGLRVAVGISEQTTSDRLIGNPTAFVWTVPDCKLVRTFLMQESITSIAFSADRLKIAVGHHDSHIGIWNIRTGDRESRFVGHDLSTTQRDIPAVRVGQVREIPPYLGLRTRCVSGVVFSKQGGFLFSSGADGTYRVNSVLPNRQSRTDTIVGEPVSIYAPVSDGALVASWRGGLHHWNPTTHVRTLIPVPGQVLAVAVAGDGERFAVLIDTPTMLPGDFSDRSLLIFRLTERILERTIPVEPGPILTPLCFSRGGQILNLAVDNTICRWQVATGEALTTLKPPSPRILGLMPGPDDHELIISDTSKSRIVDIRSGESRVFGSEVIGQPLRNSISENGRKMVTMTRDTNPIRLRLWLIDRDATPMTTSLLLPVDSRSIFAISPDGRCVAIADLTGEVSIWHLATHQELLKLGSTGTVMRLNFSADGRTLFTLIRGPNQSPAWLQAWGEFRRD